MQAKRAKTVAEYIASLPEDRRGAIKTVRAVVKKNLPAGYKEGMNYGFIGWTVPLSVYPDTYNGQPLCYAALANQKNHMALYLMAAYAEGPIKQRLVKGFRAAGKKLDMGKSCVRFKRLADLHLPAIGVAIAALPVKEFVRRAQATNPAMRKAAREASAKPRPAASARDVRRSRTSR